MYNKLFTKILDSSVWLEATPTRIVWVTFIACMDQDSTVALSSIGNVAARARVTDEEAAEAVACLEAPDSRNPDQDQEGRRIERIPGVGWHVINGQKYRDIVTAETIRAQNRARARKHRESRNVTQYNGTVTHHHENVTPSEAEAEANTKAKREKKASLSPAAPPKAQTGNQKRDPFTDPTTTERAGRFVDRYAELYSQYRKGARYASHPTRDYNAAVTLCHTWPSDRLEKLAIIFLTTDHKFAEEGSRTIPQFLALASWADGLLAEHESQKAAR